MSRINEIKKQYPELNVSLIDVLCKLDPTKTYKYLPLLCKIFGERFNMSKQHDIRNKVKLSAMVDEFNFALNTRGINLSNPTPNETYAYYQMTEFYNGEIFSTMSEFIERMEKNQISNKDVTSYADLDSIRGAISVAALNEYDKDLESQVIKEYEDDTWLIVRPLTFQSSSKYGASTRWCTTYQKEKHYFERYWSRGILVYFINKITGYKFAGFKSLGENDTELSFWDASDNRIDYLDTEADDYLYPIVKKILSSKKTNRDLCTSDIITKVEDECVDHCKMEIPRPIRQVTEEDENPTTLDEQNHLYLMGNDNVGVAYTVRTDFPMMTG